MRMWIVSPSLKNFYQINDQLRHVFFTKEGMRRGDRNFVEYVEFRVWIVVLVVYV